MPRRRNNLYARNKEGRRTLLHRVVLLETTSLLLVTLPLFVGGMVPAIGLVVALLLQFNVACVALDQD